MPASGPIRLPGEGALRDESDGVQGTEMDRLNVRVKPGRGIDHVARVGGGSERDSTTTPSPQPYDFRRPSRFSKDHLRALQTIHERFARLLMSALTSYLRMNVRIQMRVAEQAIFDEYVEQLPTPLVIYVLRLPPLDGPMIVELALPPTLAMLDRLCGGQGVVTNPEREPTEIEQSLLHAVGRHLVRAVSDAWNGVAQLEPQVDDILLNPRTVRAAAPNEVVALLRLDFVVGDVGGAMNLCLPYVALEPVIDRLNQQAWLTEQHRADSAGIERILRERIAVVPLDAKVDLGQVELSASALASLRVGDVIRLGTAATGTLELHIAGYPLFRCRPGLSAGNIAVQIVSLSEMGKRTV